MAQTQIAFCDLCSQPYEVGGQMNGAELMADVFVKNFNTYRERFNLCLHCLEKTGLLNILRQMSKQKAINDKKIKNMKKGYLSTVTKNVLQLSNYSNRK